MNAAGAHRGKSWEPLVKNMPFNAKDSKIKLRELVSMVRTYGTPSYFLTFTPNYSGFPGLTSILKSVEHSPHKLPGVIPQLQLQWYHSIRLIISWLMNGKDEVLGKAKHYWWRFEFQTDVGHLPHVHVLLWTHETGQPCADRIVVDPEMHWQQEPLLRNTAFSRLSHRCELQSVKDHEQYLQTIQRSRCLRRTPEGTFRCRFNMPNVPRSKAQQLIITPHLPNTVQEILQECQAELPTSGRWLYKTGFGCNFVSPYLPQILANFKNHHNCLTVDSRLSSQYLTKYQSGEEERAKAHPVAKGKHDVHFVAEDEMKRKRKNVDSKQGAYNCRLLSDAEITLCGLLVQYRHTDIHTINLNIGAPEYRQDHVTDFDHFRIAPSYNNSPLYGALNHVIHLWNHHAPNNLRPHGTQHILRTHLDNLPLKHWGAMDTWSLRPTHLQYCPVTIYFELFNVIPLEKEFGRKFDDRTTIVNMTEWVNNSFNQQHQLNNLLHRGMRDASYRRVILRQGTLRDIDNRNDILLFLQQLQNMRGIFEELANTIHTILQDMRRRQTNPFHPNLLPKYIYDNWIMTSHTNQWINICNIEPTVVVAQYWPPPSKVIRFLIMFINNFIIHTTGEWTEHHFYAETNIRQVCAKWVQGKHRELTNIYFNQVLKHEPVGNRHFSTLITEAWRVFSAVCRPLDDPNESLYGNDIQLDRQIVVLHSECEEAILEAFNTYSTQRNDKFNESARQYNDEANGIHWDEDQTIVNNNIDKCINDVKDSNGLKVQRGILICGAPGTGKTLMASHALRNCINLGLRVEWTAYSAQCAATHDGLHICRLFKIWPSKSNDLRTPVALANSALSKLSKSPTAKLWLQTRDVIFVDEAFFVPVEIILAMDIILRAIRNQLDIPFGGVFTIFTGDHYQTLPIDSRFFLLSATCKEWFNIYDLKV